MPDVVRVPVKVKRKAIIIKSIKSGGWTIFKRPTHIDPPRYHLQDGEKVLWCPYCADYTIWQTRGGNGKEKIIHDCLGPCGWANTNDFYVQTVNDLWPSMRRRKKD